MNNYGAKVIFLNLLRRIRLLKYFNFILFYDNIKIPIINGVGLGLLEKKELWMDLLIKKIIRKNPGLFLDVGANIGQTLTRLKQIAPEKKYQGFEPNPRAFQYLKKLIESNDWTNVDVQNYGLGLKDEVLKLHLYNNLKTDEGATMLSNFRPGKAVTDVIDVRVIGKNKIDSVVKNKVGCIKVDVEGMEFDVLTCLEEVIKRDFPVLIFELLPAYDDSMINRIANQNGVVNFLKRNNYSFYRIIEKEYESKCELLALSEVEIHGNMDWTNYIAFNRNDGEINELNFDDITIIN